MDVFAGSLRRALPQVFNIARYQLYHGAANGALADQSPCRIQAKMYRLIDVTSAISTHCTMAWSIHEPGGGAPGRMLRSGTIANRFAAYHVANGGRNFLRPNAIGMATSRARVGRLIRTRQMPRSKISGPLALLKV